MSKGEKKASVRERERELGNLEKFEKKFKECSPTGDFQMQTISKEPLIKRHFLSS